MAASFDASTCSLPESTLSAAFARPRQTSTYERSRPMDEIKYRYLRWKMGRARSKFDVYSGGRTADDDDWKSDWKKHIH